MKIEAEFLEGLSRDRGLQDLGRIEAILCLLYKINEENRSRQCPLGRALHQMAEAQITSFEACADEMERVLGYEDPWRGEEEGT